MRFLALLLVPLVMLAGCGNSDAAKNASAPVSGAPVANVAPPKGKQWTDVVVKTPEGGHLMGNPNAPIKLLEYGSRGCPVCGAFANAGMETLWHKYVDSGKVSYEFREFWVHGAPDVSASLIGNCVPTEAYFPVLEQMYVQQPTLNGHIQALSQAQIQQLQSLPAAQAPTAWAEAAGYIDFIKQRGVPEAKARQCLTDQALLKQLADVNQKGAEDMGVTGTPTFFLNGNKLNAISWPDVEAALKQAGAR